MEFKKYDKIFTIGHEENKDIFSNPEDEIVIQEKIDGGNFRFYITEEGKIIIGSRTQQLTNDEGEDTNIHKMFVRCANFVREKLSGKELNKYSRLIFFGENCVKHTINYDWDRMPLFLGYDIYSFSLGKYLDYYDIKKIYDELGLEIVPLIAIKKVNEIGKIDESMIPVSKYALQSSKEQKAEGLVFKNYNKQLFSKIVLNEFKEKNAEVFGGSPKYNKDGDTNNADFIFKYCTNPRIEKIIFKELEKGKNLDMVLMGTIIKEVYLDIITEEWMEILTSNWILDLKKCRQLIAPRCRAVLQQMIINNAR